MNIILDFLQIISALADKNRYKIIYALLQRDYCVGGLARKLDISEAAVSQHLKILKDANLIFGNKNGYFRHYRVNQELMKQISQEFEKMSEQKREKKTLCPPKNKEDCVLCRSEILEKTEN